MADPSGGPKSYHFTIVLRYLGCLVPLIIGFCLWGGILGTWYLIIMENPKEINRARGARAAPHASFFLGKKYDDPPDLEPQHAVARRFTAPLFAPTAPRIDLGKYTTFR